jgi:retron-type reverse transcriptase
LSVSSDLDRVRQAARKDKDARFTALPSRRVYVPKPDGRRRPLGVASLEDKIVQRAVAEVLNAIYECDFLGFFYGFRPGRSPHDALDALAVGIEKRRVNWILDADIRDYFSTLDHVWLERFLERRIADGRVRRSQRPRLTWERMHQLDQRWLPTDRILHPWPSVRFDARTQARSPVR